MPEHSVRCHACQREHVYVDVLGRGRTCDGCGAYLRCCRTCTFYDPTAYNECREPSAERVVDKEQGTFCDYFAPASGGDAGSARESSPPASELDKLFR